MLLTTTTEKTIIWHKVLGYVELHKVYNDSYYVDVILEDGTITTIDIRDTDY